MGAELRQLTFLKESIDARISSANSRRVYFRKRALVNYISAAILGAITTILLGLNIEPLKEHIRIAALILSALTTLLNVYTAFYSDKEMWVANNNAINRFYQLQFDIGYEEKRADALTDAQVDDFRKTYQDILDELNTTWAKSRMTNARSV